MRARVAAARAQALKHYGESVRLGHKAILQSLPRLLTLYFEFGSKMAATKNPSQKHKTAQTQVRLLGLHQGAVAGHAA